MRQAGLLGVALLCCLELVVTAQVNVTEPPPKAPSYTPNNTSSFPGVSASQFPRAGVSADAFERPGVSADQLRTLIPGNPTTTCAKQSDVVLHPDPERPPRPVRSVRSVTDEQ